MSRKTEMQAVALFSSLLSSLLMFSCSAMSADESEVSLSDSGAETSESVVAAERKPAESSPPDVLRLPELPPQDSFDDMLERPLFSDNRRPDAIADTGDAVSARELKETWQLTGIIIVGGENHAMLRERSGERHLLLTTGMPLDNTWQLSEIDKESVVMVSGDEQVRLDLREPRDTQSVETEAGEETAEGNPDDKEVQPLEGRAQEAIDRLRQRLQTTREQSNE